MSTPSAYHGALSTWAYSIAARRAWLILALALASLSLVGCGMRSPVPDKSRDTVVAGFQKILDTIVLGP